MLLSLRQSLRIYTKDNVAQLLHQLALNSDSSRDAYVLVIAPGRRSGPRRKDRLRSPRRRPRERLVYTPLIRVSITPLTILICGSLAFGPHGDPWSKNAFQLHICTG